MLRTSPLMAVYASIDARGNNNNNNVNKDIETYNNNKYNHDNDNENSNNAGCNVHNNASPTSFVPK